MAHPDDQLIQFQPGGTDYAQLITTGTPAYSDLPTALLTETRFKNFHVQNPFIFETVFFDFMKTRYILQLMSPELVKSTLLS